MTGTDAQISFHPQRMSRRKKIGNLEKRLANDEEPRGVAVARVFNTGSNSSFISGVPFIGRVFGDHDFCCSHVFSVYSALFFEKRIDSAAPIG